MYIGDCLQAPGVLRTHDYLVSRNGVFSVIQQADGSLALYASTNKGALQLFATPSGGPGYCALQRDGNLVQYKGTPESPGPAYWKARTVAPHDFDYFVMLQDDGNLVIYDRKYDPTKAPWDCGMAVWFSNTGQEWVAYPRVLTFGPGGITSKRLETKDSAIYRFDVTNLSKVTISRVRIGLVYDTRAFQEASITFNVAAGASGIPEIIVDEVPPQSSKRAEFMISTSEGTLPDIYQFNATLIDCDLNASGIPSSRVEVAQTIEVFPDK